MVDEEVCACDASVMGVRIWGQLETEPSGSIDPRD